MGFWNLWRIISNNGVLEGSNNKIKTAFTRSYGFKTVKYRKTMIYIMAGKLNMPTRCLREAKNQIIFSWHFIGTIPKSSYSNKYIRCRCDYKSVKSVKSVSFNFSWHGLTLIDTDFTLSRCLKNNWEMELCHFINEVIY